MGDRGHNRYGPKEGATVPLSRRELGPSLTQCGLGRRLLPYHVTSWSIQPFGHNRYAWAENGAGPLFGGSGSPSNTMSPGAEAYLRTKWYPDASSRLVTIYMGRKLGAATLLRGAGSPSDTVPPGLRPTSLPSGILIHPAIWPQRTWAENFRVVRLLRGKLGHI